MNYSAKKATFVGLNILIALTFLFSVFNAHAWVSHDAPAQTYTFKFKMPLNKPIETWEYTVKGSSQDEALQKAAGACFQHFKGGRQVSENRGLDIIDTCANPRT